MSRCYVSSPITFYVNNVTGNDTTGDGSAACPWQTIQHAVNTLQSNYDFAAQPTIQLATTGVNYSEAVALGRYVGSLGWSASGYTYPTIQGDPTNNYAVCIYPGTGAPFTSVNGNPWIISSLRVCANGTYGIISDAHAHLLLSNMNFGICGLGHMFAEYGGFIETLAGPYTISEGTPYHITVCMRGEFVSQGNAVTFTATNGGIWPAFVRFVGGVTGGLLNIGQMTLVAGGHTTQSSSPASDGTALLYPMSGGSFG